MLNKLQNTDANMSNAVAALLVFSVLLCFNAQAFPNSDADCCLSTTETFVPHRIVESYTIQTRDAGCSIPATVFITKKKRRLCSPPVYDQRYPWVGRLVQILDNRYSKIKGGQ